MIDKETKGHNFYFGWAIISTCLASFAMGRLRVTMEERDESINENISLSEELRLADDRFAGLVGLIRKQNEATSQGLKVIFPALEGTPLRQDETTTIKNSLELTLTQEEAVRRAKNNVCRYSSFFHTEGKRIKGDISGSCILLSDTIVLTAYHVADDDNLGKYYDVASFVQTPDGRRYVVQKSILGSPRYDFALVELKYPVEGIEPIPVGQIREEGELVHISMNSGTVTERELTYKGNNDELGWSAIVINQMGALQFPSIYVSETLSPGESGSAVLQNGKIVGLVVQGRESYATVSHQLYNFLNCAVNQPCDGWME